MAIPDTKVREALDIAYEAGFRGAALVYSVAIAMRESGLRSDARCYNIRDPRTGRNTCVTSMRPGVTSVDRGWWQINSKAHPNVSDSEADDPRAAARHAYRISSGGTNFRAWVAFTTGAFRTYLAQVSRVAGIPIGELPATGQKFAFVDSTAGAGAGRPATAALAAGSGGFTVTQTATGASGSPKAGPFGDLVGGLGGAVGGVFSGLFGSMGEAIERAAASTVQGIFRLTILGAVLVGGVTLVVIGAWRAVAPTRERAVA